MKLTNEHSEASVQPLGAMLHDCVFRLANGRKVRPLFDAPWRGDAGPEFEAQPPIVQGLASEWPCVPFGRPSDDVSLPPEWTSSDVPNWDDWAHGYASNNKWHLERLGKSVLRAVIHYPDTTPILRLEREVRLLTCRPGLSLSLTIHARHKTRFPFGLHPVLSMEGAAPGTLRIETSEQARVWSLPIDVEPGRNHFLADQQNCALDRVAICSGGTADVRYLPPPGQTEDLLLLSGTGGSVGLSNPNMGYTTTIRWDGKQIPGCLLWVSNAGRDYYPWNGRV
ncbi:MAG: hypothetical protein ACSHWS_05790, partial [Sulfitobacter sp.]